MCSREAGVLARVPGNVSGLPRDPGATQVCLLQQPDGSVALHSAGECNTHSLEPAVLRIGHSAGLCATHGVAGKTVWVDTDVKR